MVLGGSNDPSFQGNVFLAASIDRVISAQLVEDPNAPSKEDVIPWIAVVIVPNNPKVKTI